MTELEAMAIGVWCLIFIIIIVASCMAFQCPNCGRISAERPCPFCSDPIE